MGLFKLQWLFISWMDSKINWIHDVAMTCLLLVS